MIEPVEMQSWQQSALDWLVLNVPRIAKITVLLLVCGLWWLICWSAGWSDTCIAVGILGHAASQVWTDNKP